MQSVLNAIAQQGRRGDTSLGHLTPGEVVVPREVAALRPDLMAALGQQHRKMGGNPRSLIVGKGKTNPYTGLQEFATAEEVQAAYASIGRASPDQEGINYWMGQDSSALGAAFNYAASDPATQANAAAMDAAAARASATTPAAPVNTIPYTYSPDTGYTWNPPAPTYTPSYGGEESYTPAQTYNPVAPATPTYNTGLVYQPDSRVFDGVPAGGSTYGSYSPSNPVSTGPLTSVKEVMDAYKEIGRTYITTPELTYWTAQPATTFDATFGASAASASAQAAAAAIDPGYAASHPAAVITPWTGDTPLGGQLSSGYDFSGWGAKDINDYSGQQAALDAWRATATTTGEGGDLPNPGFDPENKYSYMNDEGARYMNAGLNDPRYQWAVKNAAKTSDKFDDVIAAHPELLGRINDRAYRGIDDASAFQGSALSAYYAAQLQDLGLTDELNLNPNQKAAGDKWNKYMSPEAQDGRAPKPSGMSPLLMIAGAIAAAYGIPALVEMMGTAGAGEAAGMSGALGGGVSGASLGTALGGADLLGAGTTLSATGAGSAGVGSGLFGQSALGATGLGSGLSVGAGAGAGIAGAGLGGIFGTGLDLGSDMVNKLGEKLTTNTLTSGGDIGKGAQKTAMGAAVSGLGAAGSALGTSIVGPDAGGMFNTGLDLGTDTANKLGEKLTANTITAGGDVGKGALNTATGEIKNYASTLIPDEVTQLSNAVAPVAKAATTGLGVAKAIDAVSTPTHPVKVSPVTAPPPPSSTLVNGVNSMYTSALGRSPTSDELAHWNSLAIQGFSPTDIVAEFKKSPEFINERNAIKK